jgi:hypothetical protein
MKLTSTDRAALRDLLARPATAADLKRSLGGGTGTGRPASRTWPAPVSR